MYIVYYLCIMEENYLYPGDIVKPVEVGESYMDYMLSDVLANAGISFISGHMHYGREKTEHIDGRPKSKDYCFALVNTDKGKFMLAPISCFKPRVMEDFPPMPFPDIFPTHEFVDLRIRYYLKGKEVLRPVWYSAKCKDKEELVKGDDGHWHHVPTYKDRYSVFAKCPYCTSLITGPLFEFPDMKLEWDGYIRYVHSDYLVVLE